VTVLNLKRAFLRFSYQAPWAVCPVPHSPQTKAQMESSDEWVTMWDAASKRNYLQHK